MINWNCNTTLGTPIGTVKVENQEGASSIAEFVVQASSVAGGSPVTISYNGSTLFAGVVDEAHALGQGLVRVICVHSIQMAANALSRTQIDALFTDVPWHPDLSDDAKQGWAYLEDRLSTFLGTVRLQHSGTLELVPWSAASGTPSQSQIIEDSYQRKTPAYRDLVGQTIFEIDYRCETFEEARCYMSWKDDSSGWWRDALWGTFDTANRQYWAIVKFYFDLKLASLRPQAHEIWSMLHGTGWKPAVIDGDGISAWRDGVRTESEVSEVEVPLPVPPGYAAGMPKVVVSAAPTVSSFHAWLVKRFGSEILINGEHRISTGQGGIEREKISYRYEAERLSVEDYKGAEGTVRADWEDQLEQLPQLNYQQDFTRWLNAHRYRAARKHAEARRGETVTYRVACTPMARPDGAIVRVVHELDAEAGTAITEIEQSLYGRPSISPVTFDLAAPRARAPWPRHTLSTRTLHGEIQRPVGTPIPARKESARRDEYGLVKTVNGYLVWGVGDTRPQAAMITNAAKNSFRLPRPEYTDTGPRTIQLNE